MLEFVWAFCFWELFVSSGVFAWDGSKGYGQGRFAYWKRILVTFASITGHGNSPKLCTFRVGVDGMLCTQASRSS